MPLLCVSLILTLKKEKKKGDDIVIGYFKVLSKEKKRGNQVQSLFDHCVMCEGHAWRMRCCTFGNGMIIQCVNKLSLQHVYHAEPKCMCDLSPCKTHAKQNSLAG